MEDRRAGREPRTALSPHRGRCRARQGAVAAGPLGARGTLAARLALVAIAAAIAGPAGPAAAGPFETIAGWEGDTHEQGYGFVTVGALVPAGPGVEFPLRLSANHLVYRYDSSGTEIRVRAPGVSLLVGPRLSRPAGSFAVMAGAEVRREHREAGLAGAPERDRTVGGFVAQLEGDAPLSRRWRAIALASYAGAASYVYARGSLRWQANDLDWQGPLVFFTGLEAVGQGNSDSRGWQAGAFTEWALVRRHLSLALHAGYRESGSAGDRRFTGAYLGVGAYRRF